MGGKIQILEVGPRDGFQNLKQYVSIDEKLKIIDALIASGVKHIQHTSFVSPKAVPQFLDSTEITKILLNKYPEFDFIPLVPNYHGASKAFKLRCSRISYVISLSASHNRENINRTHEESFNELKRIMNLYDEKNINIDIATTFGCPYEGRFSIHVIVKFIERIVNIGIKTITLADTIGIADPKQVKETVKAVKREYPDIEFRVHIHDTKNMGMASTLAAIESGITQVDASLGGLGGCPFAPGASGNTATEDLVYMLHRMGYDTGIDFDKLLETSKYEKSIIDGNYSGHHINITAETHC